ncbi:MAG: hypothetical protein ACQEV7_04040 [Bacillota bacterium]
MNRIQSILENIGEDYKEELEVYGALRKLVAARLINGARKGLDRLEERL